MNTLHRTLISFGAFLINYWLVMAVHPSGVEPLEWAIVWLVCITMGIVSLVQWDLSWFFGSYAGTYAIMIASKGVLSWQTLVALVSVLAMIGGVTGGRVFHAPFRVLGQCCRTVFGALGSLGGNWSRRRLVRRLHDVAEIRMGGEQLSDEALQEFLSLDKEVGKIRAFFDGSDPALEKSLSGTVAQIEMLQRDHTRLLLRDQHLQILVTSEPCEPLENGIKQLTENVQTLSDPVARKQLELAIEMKQKRLAELGNLQTCRQRVQGQRLQIGETIQGLFHRLNSLKYSDIQTLEATRNHISDEIQRLSSGLDDLKESLISVETMVR